MTSPTERRNERSLDLDRLRAPEILALMDDEERQALRAVEAVRDLLALAAERVAAAYESGGRTVYLGAGTSGHLALLDAAEVPDTFGIAHDRFFAVVATGSARASAVVATSEDDVSAVVTAIDGAELGPHDVVIGLAASGTTPFVVQGIEHARRRGSATIGIANNPATPLLRVAELGIFLDTGAEILTGSTRLKAGTAEKLALNRISTVAMVIAGRVVSNLMVEVKPSNVKLERRCVQIVGELTGVDEATARALLGRADGSVRRAVELAGGFMT